MRPASGPAQQQEKERGMAEDHHIIPVWFFIGATLLIYGVLILGNSLIYISQPPTTVLGELRPQIWWGAILILIGGVYVYLFRPGRS
jgi:FtsH-binding integral membrane protein